MSNTAPFIRQCIGRRVMALLKEKWDTDGIGLHETIINDLTTNIRASEFSLVGVTISNDGLVRVACSFREGKQDTRRWEFLVMEVNKYMYTTLQCKHYFPKDDTDELH